MGCAMSACSGLTTVRKLASDDDDDDDESHYGERRANGKRGVVADKCERELASGEQSVASVNVDDRTEIDHETLQCGQWVSRAELVPAHNVRAGEMSGERPMTQRATTKRKREVRSATTSTREDEQESTVSRSKSNRKRTNNLSALLLAIISRGRRHSSTRIDVTRDAPGPRADSSLQISSLHAPNLLAEPPQPPIRDEIMVIESAASDGQLAMARSTPTITLGSDQQAAGLCHSAGGGDAVSLFTSTHQLCYEIINCKLLGPSPPSPSPPPPPPLCLFVFGRPGSSRGELAFELVEHSPLIDFIAHCEEAANETSVHHQTSCDSNNSDCPLYHYLDVSSLIVANIDARIREYNRLVAQTLRARRHQQLAGEETSSLESQVISNNGSHEGEDGDGLDESESENVSESSRIDQAVGGGGGGGDDEEEQESDTTSGRDLPPKELIGPSDDNKPPERTSVSDQFGLITLSTKQRSILQLKMIKYACCVTAKWVMHLLRREIGLLEERLAARCRAMAARDHQHVFVLPRRVYLVNLVPNQLSLFKTCLYLQQSLPLGQLRMPHWAVKFERRTNIRLMMNRERATSLSVSRQDGDASQHQRQSITLARPTGRKVLIQFKRLSQIKLLPTVLVPGPAVTRPDLTTAQNFTIQQDDTAPVGSVAANLLAHGPNEKLGPKYNDLFAQQFATLDKLTRLRYNPTRNYNYSDDHHHLHREDLGSSTPVGHDLVSSPTRDSCQVKLRHSSDFELLDPSCEPASPPSSLSQVSSRAGHDGSRPMIVASEFTGQRLLVSPSPCPSSVASDESSALSYDALVHQRHQQLSPTFTYNHTFRFPPQASNQHPPLKWAIELELIDCEQTRIRWYQQAPESSAAQTDCCLHVYRDQKRPVRSRSHASLLGPSSAATMPGTVCHADNYYLVATRVAYATGKSQPVLEVKRLHKRVIRCSQSRSDLTKLRKLISRASVCLARDLDTWLRESICDTPHSPPPSSPLNIGKHAAGHQAGAFKSIALVTYTIRVDASKLLAEPARQQDNVEVPRLTLNKPHTSNSGEHLEPPSPISPDPIVQLLRTQPKRSNLTSKQRASSARQLSDQLVGVRQQQQQESTGRAVSPDGLSLQLPASGSGQNPGGGTGRGDSSTRSSSPRQRHVQFKLGQAPVAVGRQPADAPGTCDAQRRLWLRDNLFASSNEARLFPAMDSLVAALKSIENVAVRE